jgi:hypothetical protein
MPSIKQVKLTQGFVAFVDEEDFERINAVKWHASVESRGTKIYACRFKVVDGRRYKIRMHREVMGLPPLGRPLQPGDQVVNHESDDSLDNTRGNLRICTQPENMAAVPNWKRKKEVECQL